MSELEKFPITYEYNETHVDIKRLFRDIKKYQSKQLSTIRKLAKSGTPLTELAKTYDMTVQKIVAIVRSKK